MRVARPLRPTRPPRTGPAIQAWDCGSGWGDGDDVAGSDIAGADSGPRVSSSSGDSTEGDEAGSGVEVLPVPVVTGVDGDGLVTSVEVSVGKDSDDDDGDWFVTEASDVDETGSDDMVASSFRISLLAWDSIVSVLDLCDSVDSVPDCLTC